MTYSYFRRHVEHTTEHEIAYIDGLGSWSEKQAKRARAQGRMGQRRIALIQQYIAGLELRDPERTPFDAEACRQHAHDALKSLRADVVFEEWGELLARMAKVRPRVAEVGRFGRLLDEEG